MTFGQRLKKLRLSKNITQIQLAQIIEKSRTSIAGYETDDRMPDIKTLKDIASFFEVSTDYLLGITNDLIKENENIDLYIYNDVADRVNEIPSIYDISINDLEKDFQNICDKIDNDKHLVWQGKPLTDELRHELKGALSFFTNMVKQKNN